MCEARSLTRHGSLNQQAASAVPLTVKSKSGCALASDFPKEVNIFESFGPSFWGELATIEVLLNSEPRLLVTHASIFILLVQSRFSLLRLNCFDA